MTPTALSRSSAIVRPVVYRAATPNPDAATAVASFKAGSLAKAVVIEDSAANIKAKWTDLKALATAGKISSFKIKDASKPTISLTAADLANSTALMGKISSVAFVKVSDTSANIALKFADLLVQGSKINSIEQTGTKAALALTSAQFAAGASVLGKIDSGNYTVSLNDVSAKTLAAVNANAKVTSFNFVDTSANIALQLPSLKTASKLQNITASGVPSAITLTDANYLLYTSTLAKITGSYSLALTGVAATNVATRLENTKVTAVSVNDSSSNVVTQLAALETASTKLKTIALTDVKPGLSLSVAQMNSSAVGKIISKYTLSVADTSANIQANLDKLNLKASVLSGIKTTDTSRATLTVTAAQYKTYAAVLAKTSGAAVSVKLSDNYNPNNVKTNTDGSFAVTEADVKYSMKGVNFFEFDDFTVFGDSGDANVNALLSGTTKQWWFDSSAKGAKTSDTLIKPGLYALDEGSSKHTFTYSFIQTLPATATQQDRTGFAEMNATQKAAVADAFTYLSSLINVTFTNSGATDGSADINFGTNQQANSAGYANPPNASGAHNVFLMLDKDEPTNLSFAHGSYGWETLIHEIGHTLGLKHPGNYNAGGGGAAGPYLPKTTDTRRNSVMSYNQPADAMHVTITDIGASAASFNPSTLMTYDVTALQYLYGKSKSPTNLGSYQTLSFDANWKGFQSTYTPEGGTLDMSSVTKSNIVDLRPGAYSSINTLATDIKTYLTTVPQGLQSYVKTYQSYLGYNNVSINYGSYFDAVVGGTANDAVFVDPSAIVTDQNIDGGSGSDVVYLAGTAADWALDSWDGSTDKDATASNGSGDKKVVVNLKNIELIKYYSASTYTPLHSALDLLA